MAANDPASAAARLRNIENGDRREWPEVALEGGIASVEAPPLEESVPVGQEKLVWLNDGSQGRLQGFGRPKRQKKKKPRS